MGASSAIEWTQATWNPLVGCTKVSPGCDHCYAETLVNRFAGKNKGFPNRFDVVTLRDDKMLTQPLRWRQPRRIFVNSLSDLFHKDVPPEFIARVFAVMALAPQHTFQLLTKRPGRMRSRLSDGAWRMAVAIEMERLRPFCLLRPRLLDRALLPSLNVWLGVSVESADWLHRVDVLRGTPAAVRWISAEPLLGPLDGLDLTGIDWVVAGGESGPGARPMHPDWARSLRDQCVAAGVPFLFKQWGNWAPHLVDGGTHTNVRVSRNRDQYESRLFAPDGTAYIASQPDLYGYPGMTSMLNVGKKAAGRVLDGRTWDEYPAVTS